MSLRNYPINAHCCHQVPIALDRSGFIFPDSNFLAMQSILVLRTLYNIGTSIDSSLKAPLTVDVYVYDRFLKFRIMRQFSFLEVVYNIPSTMKLNVLTTTVGIIYRYPIICVGLGVEIGVETVNQKYPSVKRLPWENSHGRN